jgi:hypothetical protein
MPGEGERFYRWLVANEKRLDIDIPPVVRAKFTD